MSDRVLVTGATGFIGHHLVETLLEKGDRIVCLVRPTSDTSDLPVEKLDLRIGDVTDSASVKSAVKGVDVVYHLAGVTVARRRSQFQAINAQGVANVARACAGQPSQPTLVVLSSLAAAGPSQLERPHTESDAPVPMSAYGRSKLDGELAARSFSSEVPITIVRAPWVFGEWDNDTYKIFRMIRYGLLPVPVPDSNRYSLIHASDLAACLILAAERGERTVLSSAGQGSGLYYAAFYSPLSYAEIGHAIGNAMGKIHPIVFHVPKVLTFSIAGILEFGARVVGRTPDIVNLEKAKEAYAGSWTCSPGKAREELQFEVAKDLPERLNQTADWYAAEGWL